MAQVGRNIDNHALAERAKELGVLVQPWFGLDELTLAIERKERELKMAEIEKETAGLPVHGYKPVQPAWALDLVNENKILEEKVLRQIDQHHFNSSVDGRAVAIARTKIEEGFMWLNRAVFQPSRVTLPEDKG